MQKWCDHGCDGSDTSMWTVPDEHHPWISLQQDSREAMLFALRFLLIPPASPSPWSHLLAELRWIPFLSLPHPSASLPPAEELPHWSTSPPTHRQLLPPSLLFGWNPSLLPLPLPPGRCWSYLPGGLVVALMDAFMIILITIIMINTIIITITTMGMKEVGGSWPGLKK